MEVGLLQMAVLAILVCLYLFATHVTPRIESPAPRQNNFSVNMRKNWMNQKTELLESENQKLLERVEELRSQQSIGKKVAWPRPVSKVKVKKRKFNEQDAIKEVKYERTGGGLTIGDRDILAKHYYRVNSLCEFGLGESTRVAMYVGMSRYLGVDGSNEWINFAKEGTPDHWRFHWADMGPLGAWSNPAEGSKAQPKFPFYGPAALAGESIGFEFYLVDGRFRVAVAAACFLHASRSGMRPSDFLVAIHDYGNRPHYNEILKIATIVEGYDSPENKLLQGTEKKKVIIAVFRRKPDVTDDEVYAIWEKYHLVVD